MAGDGLESLISNREITYLPRVYETVVEEEPVQQKDICGSVDCTTRQVSSSLSTLMEVDAIERVSHGVYETLDGAPRPETVHLLSQLGSVLQYEVCKLGADHGPVDTPTVSEQLGCTVKGARKAAKTAANYGLIELDATDYAKGTVYFSVTEDGNELLDTYTRTETDGGEISLRNGGNGESLDDAQYLQSIDELESPRAGDVADAAGQHIATVWKRLGQLEDEGLLEREKREEKYLYRTTDLGRTFVADVERVNEYDSRETAVNPVADDIYDLGQREFNLLRRYYGDTDLDGRGDTDVARYVRDALRELPDGHDYGGKEPATRNRVTTKALYNILDVRREQDDSLDIPLKKHLSMVLGALADLDLVTETRSPPRNLMGRQIELDATVADYEDQLIDGIARRHINEIYEESWSPDANQ